MLKQRKKNKLTTTFDVRPYRVVLVKGTAAIIERGRQRIMRNLSLLKKIPLLCDDTPCLKLPHTTYPDSDLESELDFDSSALDLPVMPRPELPPLGRADRPQRNRRPPPRYGDFLPH